MEFDRTGKVEERLFRPRPKDVDTIEVSVKRYPEPVLVRIQPINAAMQVDPSQADHLVDLVSIADSLSGVEDTRFVLTSGTASCTVVVSADVAGAAKDRAREAAEEESRKRAEELAQLRRELLRQDTTCLLGAYPGITGLPPEFERARLLGKYEVDILSHILDGDAWNANPTIAHQHRTALQEKVFRGSPEFRQLVTEVALRKRELLDGLVAFPLSGYKVSDFNLADSSFAIESFWLSRPHEYRGQSALNAATHILQVSMLSGIWCDNPPGSWSSYFDILGQLKQVGRLRVSNLDHALAVEQAEDDALLYVVCTLTGRQRTARQYEGKVPEVESARFVFIMPVGARAQWWKIEKRERQYLAVVVE